MKKNIVTAALLTCATFSFAQENIDIRHNILETEIDTVYRKYNTLKIKTIVPQSAIAFNFSGGVLYINNDAGSKMRNNYKPGNGWSFGIDYKRQFMQTDIVNNDFVKTPSLLGIGAGLGISYLYQSSFIWDYSETLSNFTDVDSDVCDVKLSYKGIRETLTLTYLDIPLYLSIGKPSQTKISAYGNVGIKASIRVGNSFTGKGTYTSTGYYQDWGVEKYDIPELNYYTNKACYENPEVNLSPFVLWGSLSGGVSFPFSSLEKNTISNFIVCLGVKLDYTLSPISKSTSEPDFPSETYRINQSNILGSKGSRIFAPGVDIKLIYCIN